jgi:hypothetical protein
MRFILKSLGPEYVSAECFYELHAEQATFYSPVYSDKSAALLAMEELVLKLRNRKKTKVSIAKNNAAYTIALFGNDTQVVRPSTAFTDKMTAIEVFEEVLNAAAADSFPLSFMELPEAIGGIASIGDLGLRAGMDNYPWVEVNTSTLRVGVKERGGTTLMGAPFGMSPSMGVSPFSGGGPCEPLFNVLQPQVAADLPLFMGRKQEVEDLYAMTRNNRLLLLYGQPRVGKTSLIQCGLANRMEAVPGELFVHRRGAGGMLPSLVESLRTEIASLTNKPTPEATDPMDLLPLLHEQVQKPVFLVFDQLEKLFETEVTEEERNEFFAFIRYLTSEESLPYRIILSLRETFLAPLAEYEEMLPSLLTHRYRVQPLSKKSMIDVSLNLLDLFKSKGKMDVDNPEVIAEKLCSELANDKGEVPFQCLQIYMQELHQTSCAESGGKVPAFDASLIDKMGPGREVIEGYVNREMTRLESLLPEDGSPADPEVLQKINDLQESRQCCGCGDTKAVMPVAAAVVGAGVSNRSRNLRWLLLIALLALLFGALAYWLLSNWSQKQDPCYAAKQADTCEAYVNYLSKYGEDATCAAEFRELLATRQCGTLWQDYQMLQTTKTCGAYQDFFRKYRNTAVSTERVQRYLLEWQCPMVRDTVEVPVHDTIYSGTPNGFNTTGGRLPTGTGGVSRTGSNPPCQDFNGTNFKQVGPLWFMTDPLAGGPYAWEEALDACQAKGWRLPCIGEVDYLIDNIYRGQTSRAYQMLTGSGECYLMNPAQAPNERIDFWTGTEANDATAWTFYFDTQTKTIGRESNIIKGRRLPCLCVKKDPQKGSGLPPCYNKRVERN